MTRNLETLSERGWKSTRCGGFTLIELMITIALGAIVMGIGVPSYQDFVVKNRIQTQASEIRSSLAMARVEAIRRGLRVRVCPGQDRCVGANWHDGWNSFVDKNSDNNIDPNETQLEVHIRLDGGSTLTGANHVIFKSDGTASKARILNLCTADGDDSPHRRGIHVSNVGRVRVCDPDHCPPTRPI
nr:prepilin-type N-terminal cleavage/methylation domain-containing protein [Gammaproteobacteria bacterium]